MVEISCINCGKKFIEDYETFHGIVRCPECNKNMQTSIFNKKVVWACYDSMQVMKDYNVVESE
jgi:NAD-dependent SIR2 family protein deacetylase